VNNTDKKKRIFRFKAVSNRWPITSNFNANAKRKKNFMIVSMLTKRISNEFMV